MRFWLMAPMVAAAGAVILAMIVLYFPLRNFRSKYPIIRSDTDMLAFKRLASFQMYVSLAALYLTWVPLLIWMVGKFVLGQLTWLDGLLFVIVPFVVQFALSAAAIGTAKAVRSTPAEGPTLTAAACGSLRVLHPSASVSAGVRELQMDRQASRELAYAGTGEPIVSPFCPAGEHRGMRRASILVLGADSRRRTPGDSFETTCQRVGARPKVESDRHAFRQVNCCRRRHRTGHPTPAQTA